MQRPPRIVIADRSALAANLYQILLAPLPAALVVRRRIDEAFALLHGREQTDLAIMNTNTIGKAQASVATRIAAESPLSQVQKLFLVSAHEAEGDAKAQLAVLPNVSFLVRPFHPETFVAHVRALLEGRPA